MSSDNGPPTPYDEFARNTEATPIDTPEVPDFPQGWGDLDVVGHGELLALVEQELRIIMGQPGPEHQGNPGNPSRIPALEPLLREFVVHQNNARQETGRSIIPLRTLAELDAVVNPTDGIVDVLLAVKIVMSSFNRNVPLPADLDRVMARSGRVLSAAMKKEPSKRVMSVGQAPPAFKLGIAAHKQRQVMESSGFEDDPVFDNIKFVTDEGTGLVTQVIIPSIPMATGESVIQASFGIGAKDDGFHIQPVGKSNNNHDFTLTLVEPLLPPTEGMSIHEWARDVINIARAEMLEEIVRLPIYPSEVRKILEQNNDTTRALVKALEVMHVIFYTRDQRRGMDLIRYSEDELSGELDLDYVSELSILNWFATIRQYMERTNTDEETENRYHDSNGTTGILTELPVGTIYMKSDTNGGEVIPISGGRADLIALELDRSAGRNSGASTGISPDAHRISEFFTFSEVIQEVEGLFRSQSNRYRRRGIKDGKLIEIKTTLGRNLYSAYTALSQLEGNIIFRDMRIIIEDFKFQGGDGGGFGTFAPDTVPIESHVAQIHRYLFFAAAQMTRAHLWACGKGEDQATGLDDILNFMREFDVFDRITGVLRYQFADREIPVTTRLDEVTLMEVGREILADAQERNAQQKAYWIQRALKRIAGPRIEKLRRRSREVQPLPEALAPLCIHVLGRNYLGVNQLAAALFDIAEEYAVATGVAAEATAVAAESAAEILFLRENLQLDNAIQVVDENTCVIWIGGILPDSPLSQLRIAINARGQFCIRGSEGEYARGQLVSDINPLTQALTDFDVSAISEEGFRELIRQLSQAENTTGTFNDHIWTPLSTLNYIQQRASVFGETNVLDTDGEIRDLVPGKPIMCRLSLLTGQWFIDEALLGAAVDRIQENSAVDPYGILDLAELLSDEEVKQGMVKCPLPFHDNTDTPAAHLLEGAIITCFGACDCKIYVPGKMSELPVIRTHPGTRVEHYRKVSYGRRRAFTNLLEMGAVFARYDRTASCYLETRGLNPWSGISESIWGDVGQFGYIPPRVGRSIAELIATDAFRQMSRDKNMKKVPLIDLIEMLNRSEDYASVRDFVEALEALLSSLNFVDSEDDWSRLSELLTLETISELRSRGIFGFRKKLHDRIGGRFITPAFWLIPKFIRRIKKYIHIFAMANCNARGIVLEKQLYEGPGEWAHLRGFKRRRRRKGIKKGIQLRPTPPGFWVRDPEEFFAQVQDQKTLVCCEGALNAASLSRICPEHSSVTLATNGLVHKQVIALLKFLTTDPDEDGKPGLGIAAEGFKLYLAYDFDGPGAIAFEKNKKRIERAIPGLEVLPIHEILPVKMQEVLPPFDPEVFKPEQPWHGVKFDLNDIIRWRPFAKKYAHQSDNLVLKESPAGLF